MIREATTKDFISVSKQIAISYKAVYQDMMNQEYLSSIQEDHWVPILKDGIQKEDSCFIIEEDGQIIGSAVFGRNPENDMGNCALLHAIYLLPQYLRKGRGHQLFARIQKEMIRFGYEYCMLEVLTENKRAIEFYLSHGFKNYNRFTVSENGMILCCNTMLLKLPKSKTKYQEEY